MNVRALVLLVSASLLALGSPAQAVVQVDPPWIPKRIPGGPLPDEPLPPPSGWRLGPTLTFPYTMGLGLSYLWSGAPSTYRIGASWGVYGDGRTVAFDFRDYRLYAAMLYYLVPEAKGGPYVETGLGLARSSGPVLGVNWPVVPHIGFGTLGRMGETMGWDVEFTAAANGLLTFEAGLLFQ